MDSIIPRYSIFRRELSLQNFPYSSVTSCWYNRHVSGSGTNWVLALVTWVQNKDSGICGEQSETWTVLFPDIRFSAANYRCKTLHILLLLAAGTTDTFQTVSRYTVRDKIQCSGKGSN